MGNYTCVVTNTVTNHKVLGPPTPLTLRNDGECWAGGWFSGALTRTTWLSELHGREVKRFLCSVPSVLRLGKENSRNPVGKELAS